MACSEATVAPSLKALRNEVNAVAPNRNKASDGTCPSAAHSKQNPDSLHETGSAIDLTHDPAGGFDAESLFRRLQALKLTGIIHHAIFNGRIISPVDNWAVRKYTGTNDHSKHIHVAVTSLGRVWPGPWGVGKVAIDASDARGGFSTGDGGVTLGSQVGLGAGIAKGALGEAVDGLAVLKKLGELIADPENWKRIAMFVGGIVVAVGGLSIMLGDMTLDTVAAKAGDVDGGDILAAVN